MNDRNLFEPVNIGDFHLKNRIVLAPMTRSRAGSERIANDLMAEYYHQRAGAGLLITEEDCSPESLPISNRPVALLAVISTQSRSPLPVGRGVREFAIGAVSDAIDRSVRHFSAPAQSAQTLDWEAACLAWVTANKLRSVVTAYAPVGPVAERLSCLKVSLERQGVRLVQIRRAFDSATWPHATRGFFTLKSQIPRLLGRLGITDSGAERRHAAG